MSERLNEAIERIALAADQTTMESVSMLLEELQTNPNPWRYPERGEVPEKDGDYSERGKHDPG